MVQIVGVPFDYCGRRAGSRLGPAAVRLAGLVEALHQEGVESADLGDVPVGSESTAEGGLRNFAPLRACAGDLKTRVGSVLSQGELPLVIGGDHSVVGGGIAAALEAFGQDLALLWIDAHADVNTPGSSGSGNLHGMPLAALWGRPSGVTGVRDAEWGEWRATLCEVPLRPELTAWFGLRDVDPAERRLLRELPVGLPITMHDVDAHGVGFEVGRIDAWLRESGAKRLWISFDCDVLDPILAPGTGTAVRGGLSYREAHLFAELLYVQLNRSDCPYRLAGLDLVEVNPLNDTQNETAKMTVEWVASLFGKTILGR